GHQSAAQLAEEVLDLIAGDGVAGTGVDPAAFFKRASAVDANDFPVEIEEGTAAVARIDRRLGLQTVGVFENETGWMLIPVRAADDAEGDRRREVGGQEKRVPHRQRPIANAYLVAVAQDSKRKRLPLLLGQELDERDIADRVESDKHGVIKHAV